MMEEAIKALEDEGYFPAGKGRPPRGETVPQPEVDEAVVFKDFFCLWPSHTSGLFPPLSSRDF